MMGKSGNRQSNRGTTTRDNSCSEFSFCAEVIYQPTDPHCRPLSDASSVAKNAAFTFACWRQHQHVLLCGSKAGPAIALANSKLI